MNKRFFIIATTAAMLSPLSAFAQAPRAEPTDAAGTRNWTAPRTPWGEPDLQGTFSNRTITPFERPANVAGREFFTQEEVAALEKRAQEQTGDEGRSKGTRGDVERAYNDFWWDRGTKVTTPRTSLVIEPPDGRVPELTEEAKKRAADEGKRPTHQTIPIQPDQNLHVGQIRFQRRVDYLGGNAVNLENRQQMHQNHRHAQAGESVT